MVANLGDSRAVLCTRGSRNQLVPVQLTVDLKPNVKSRYSAFIPSFSLGDNKGKYLF